MTTDPKPLHERLRILAANCLKAFGECEEAELMAEAASALEEQAAARPEPMAYIEHHKGGDNLVWDNPGGKYTPLYTTPATARPMPPPWQETVEKLRVRLEEALNENARLRDAAAQGVQPLNQAGAAQDAARYRWLREQHEGKQTLQFDADGLPMPLEPEPVAFTVFHPGRDFVLEPVGCIEGELDAAIDAAMQASTRNTPPQVLDGEKAE